MRSLVTQRFIKCFKVLRDSGQMESNKSFAKHIDYLPQSLSEVLRGRRDIPLDVLRRAVLAYHLNPTYLFLGEEPMFMDTAELSHKRILTVIKDRQQKGLIAYVAPLRQQNYAQKCSDPEFIASLPQFRLPDSDVTQDYLRCFSMFGNSMQPLINDGEHLIGSYVDPIHWAASLNEQNIYIVITHHEVLIRRLINLIHDEQCVGLTQLYQTGDLQKVPLRQLKEIWQVKSRIMPFIASNDKYLQEEILQIRQSLDQQSKTLEQIQDQLRNDIDSSN